MKKVKDRSCWDIFKCPRDERETCPAYMDSMGDRCWLVAIGNISHNNSRVGVENGLKKCWDCDFFKLMHK